MTRSDIEREADEYSQKNGAKALKETEKLTAFAVAQINAAFEEAAKLIEIPSGIPTVIDLDGLHDLADAIRALKIP